MGHKVKQSLMSSRVDFFYYAFRNILLVSIPLLVVSGIVLSHLSFHSSATGSTSGSDNLAITISSSCTLSSVVNVPHNAEVYNGNYLGDIGKTTIKTLCNDGNGYTVYANGYSNNEEGNNKLINSSYPQYSIDTGLASSGLTSAWAMKLNNIPDDPSPTPPTIYSSYNDTYGLVPNTWTKVAYRQSGTTDMSEGSSFTTTYSVYASSSQYNGTYNGQVKYVLLHPYRNDSTITRTNLENAFALSGKSKINGYYAMQDMTSDICNSVTGDGESTATQLVDTRDNKLYYVTKLADGHCWMTQNLDFDIEANTTLNSNTTDLNVVYDSSTGQYAEYSDGYAESNGVIYYTPASSATTIDFQNNTVEGWSNNSSRNTPASANKTDAMETGYNALGNYYNWTVAIASNNSSVAITSAKNSICPKGWRLPTISSLSNNDFANLNLLYEDVSLAPLFFKKAGHVSASSQISDIGSIGLYISSNSYYNSGFYGASIINNTLITNTWWINDYNGRIGGDSIRCIAR